MIGGTLTPSDDILRFHLLDRYSDLHNSMTVHSLLIAIDRDSVSLDLNVSLSGNDVSLDDSLVESHWISWKVLRCWDVFSADRKTQQCLKDRPGTDFRSDQVVFAAERV